MEHHHIQLVFFTGGEDMMDLNASAWILLLSSSLTGKGMVNSTGINITDFLILSGETYRFYIKSLNGNLKYSMGATNAISHTINLPGIRRGIYFVKVQEGKEQFTKKMVVN